MDLNAAKAIVQDWVMREASDIAGFRGAFHHGSAVWQPGTTEMKATSDMDVMVVVDNPDPPLKLGKFRYRDVLFDVTWLPWSDVQTADQVLASHSLAGSLRDPDIIADPTGHLRAIQQDVSREFADRQWVLARCESVRSRLVFFLQSVKKDRPFHDNVMSWLFGTGLTTHLLLVAGLRNPTVRKRYRAARQLLADTGNLAIYDTLLEQQGSHHMHAARVQQHLDRMSPVFDAAASVIRTPVFFATDISQAARPISIDGSQELIDEGYHREAVFWIVATWARCLHIFHADAPELEQRHTAAFRELVADLGIVTVEDMQQRGDQVIASLPRLTQVAESIIETNPASAGDAP